MSSKVTVAVLISRKTSSPAVSVTLNSSDDSGVVSCVSSIVRGTLQTPGNSIREPLVPVTSLPSVCVVGCTCYSILMIDKQKMPWGGFYNQSIVQRLLTV